MQQNDDCVKELKRIGEVLAELRKDKKLTQKQLAEKAGIGRSTLANIELGNFNFEIKSLLALLKALDEGVAYVLYRAVVEPKLKVAEVNDRIFVDMVKLFIRDIFRHIR